MNSLKKINILLILLAFFALITEPGLAQKGDEDPVMLNQVKKRDQQAIDQAINGWWKTSMKDVDQRIAWWREARFGMFVHWGVYSFPAGEWKGKKVNGYSEHLMRKEKIPRAEYLEMAHRFNPVDFNADEWISDAKKAGMRYFIITAKHHDGFAMYDSKVSDYNIIRQTQFHRDPMAELSAACKRQGIKFGFYYSHAFDWEHPDAPGNDWEYDNPGGDLLLHGGANWYDVHPELLPKAVKYVNEKAIPQIKELILNYHPDILWFDTPQKLPLSENLRILQVIREIDPDVVVNGRLARSADYTFGDYKNTADRPAEFAPVTGNWEGIPTTNESYGYHKFDNSHKLVSFFIQLLAKSASRGGNLLMNIGPMGNGKMDQNDLVILEGIGKWMDINNGSIYGTDRSPLPLQSWGVCTQKKVKLYLHVFEWPINGQLIIGGLESKVQKAYLLADKNKNPLSVKRLNPLDLQVSLPKEAPDKVNTVVVLETAGPVKADTIRLLSVSSFNRLLAFDAKLTGKGFKFGDGKTNRYYVENWKQNDQKISWTVRINEPVAYQSSLRLITSPVSEGTCRLIIDKKIARDIKIPAGLKNEEIINLDLGTISLAKGVHTLELEPVEIKKAELMKLLEMNLLPIKQ